MIPYLIRQRIARKIQNILANFILPRHRQAFYDWVELNFMTPPTLKADSGNRKGSALLLYLGDPAVYPDDDVRMKDHTNVWECREIARILNRMGYDVDSVHHRLRLKRLNKKYDIAVGIDGQLSALPLPSNCIKLMHLTASNPEYINRASKERAEAVCRRRPDSARRGHINLDRNMPADTLLSANAADSCSLIGNRHTLETYPADLRGKTTCIPATTSLDSYAGTVEIPKEREFLWLGSYGMTHKGLDLLLEIFPKHPEWTLNIVGPVKREKEFAAIYRRELCAPNVKAHGFMLPGSEQCLAVFRRCFAFVCPSCAEGMCTSSLTCLKFGLVPIISLDNGIDLPKGIGRYLETCSISEIEGALAEAAAMPDGDVLSQMLAARRFAEENFSRGAFTKNMSAYMEKAINR